jgi:Domain of unknown function (DUF2382)/PRC-barrel domain
MTHPDIDTALDWRGRTVLDRDGEKIGTFEELYLDASDRPAWAAVKTGLFGRKQTFVPLSAAEPDGDDLRVPFAKDHVEAAPGVDPDAQLAPEEEDRLFRHYEMREDEPTSEAPEEAPPTSESTSEPASERTSEEGAEMIRSEEEVAVTGTQRRATGKARLKKYVVTEHVKKVVPVQREEVRLEYDPAEGEEPPADAEREARS